MRLLLEHVEVNPAQLQLVPMESESMQFNRLKQCCDVGAAYFSDDKHKIVRSYIAVYKALVKRRVESYLLGVSTRRVVYVKVLKDN